MKKMNEAKHDAIVAVLNNMDIADLVSTYNQMAEDNYDETIYTNEDYTLNELFSEPSEAIRATVYGDYHYNDDYCYFNGYGNLCSFSGLNETACPIDLDEVARWIERKGYGLSSEFADGLAEYFAEACQERGLDYDKALEWAALEDCQGEEWSDLYDYYLESLNEEDEDGEDA